MAECPKIPKVFFSKNWQAFYEYWCRRIFREGCESNRTVRVYAGTIRLFFAWLPRAPNQKSRHPESVTQQEILDFLNRPGRAGRPPSPYTYNGRLAVLASFYSYAAEYNIGKKMLFNATSPTHGLNRRATKPADRTLTPEEVNRFLAAIPRDTVAGLRDRAMVLFYLLTGRRCSEIARLCWRDLEYRGGQWWYSFKGKGHRDIDDKDILHPAAKAALDEYLEFSGRAATIQPDDALFISVKWRARTRALHPYSFSKMMAPYWRAAGLHGSCHFFRHTHAYEFWLSNGKDLIKVSKRLRHKNIQQTLAYLEAAQKTGIEELDAMAQRFNL